MDCTNLTTGRIRFRRKGWRGLLDLFTKRMLPLCVDCAIAGINARHR